MKNRQDDIEPRVLTQAMLKAATLFGLQRNDLALVLNIDESHLNDLAENRSALVQGSAEWSSAVMLVQLNTSLTALLGSDNLLSDWMHGVNTLFGKAPLEVLREKDGLGRLSTVIASMSANQSGT